MCSELYHLNLRAAVGVMDGKAGFALLSHELGRRV